MAFVACATVRVVSSENPKQSPVAMFSFLHASQHFCCAALASARCASGKMNRDGTRQRCRSSRSPQTPSAPTTLLELLALLALLDSLSCLSCFCSTACNGTKTGDGIVDEPSCFIRRPCPCSVASSGAGGGGEGELLKSGGGDA